MLATHRLLGTWRRDVDLYIAPSAFLKRKLVEGGLPEKRIAVKPNFVAQDPGEKPSLGDYALFLGRLTHEKGIETLLSAYAQDASLPPMQIAGDGELTPSVVAAAANDARITYRGRLEREGIIEALAGARSLVFPSIWYENFPVTIVEAFAQGVPVVGSRLGAVADLIEDGRTGLLFEPASVKSFAMTLSRLWQAPELGSTLGRAARKEYLDKYSGERNYDELLALYERALARPRLEAVLK
jgi:glycosyltransferase involved in cell wall biosynthesis